MLTTPEMTKRKQTYLSDKQKWQVAKYCIENKCVVLFHPEKHSREWTWKWRVTKKQTAEEITQDETMFRVSDYHLDQSMKFYKDVCEFTQSMPEIPAIQDTVEMDILTATNKRQENEIKEIAEKYAKLQTAYDSIMKSYGTLFQAMRNIAAQIPVECFGKKIPTEPRIVKS